MEGVDPALARLTKKLPHDRLTMRMIDNLLHVYVLVVLDLHPAASAPRQTRAENNRNADRELPHDRY